MDLVWGLQALRAMWKYLSTDGMSEEDITQCTEYDVLRFLRAQCLDVKAAAASYMDYRVLPP